MIRFITGMWNSLRASTFDIKFTCVMLCPLREWNESACKFDTSLIVIDLNPAIGRVTQEIPQSVAVVILYVEVAAFWDPTKCDASNFLIFLESTESFSRIEHFWDTCMRKNVVLDCIKVNKH